MATEIGISKVEAIKIIAALWHPLTKAQRKVLLKSIKIRKFEKNEVIYRGSDSPRDLMCLVFGKVKVYKEGVSGRSHILRAIKSIDFFGYRAFFAEEDYKTSAMAIDDCEVAFFPIELIANMMKENNAMSMFFLKHLAKLLGTSDDRTVSLTQKHIRGRLAETLIFLKDCYGVEEDGVTLCIYLSREDLASMSNMTTNNAIRTLSAFAAEDLIEIDGRKIKIIEDKDLRKVSRIG